MVVIFILAAVFEENFIALYPCQLFVLARLKCFPFWGGTVPQGGRMCRSSFQRTRACLFTVHDSSSVSRLFTYFIHFLLFAVFFLLYLYILDTDFMFIVYIANIFFWNHFIYTVFAEQQFGFLKTFFLKYSGFTVLCEQFSFYFSQTYIHFFPPFWLMLI